MVLSRQEIDGLIHMIGLTKDDEINCEQCLSLVAEFAERELSNKPVTEALKAVEQHLSICAECHEEYEALQLALRNIDDKHSQY